MEWNRPFHWDPRLPRANQSCWKLFTSLSNIKDFISLLFQPLLVMPSCNQFHCPRGKSTVTPTKSDMVIPITNIVALKNEKPGLFLTNRNGQSNKLMLKESFGKLMSAIPTNLTLKEKIGTLMSAILTTPTLHWWSWSNIVLTARVNLTSFTIYRSSNNMDQKLKYTMNNGTHCFSQTKSQ